MTTRRAPVVAPPLRSNRQFSLLWFGEGVSVLGAMTSTVVLPLLAVDHFHATPMQMGLLSAAVWTPWLALGLIAGALVDRMDNRRVMIGADVVAAAALATIPLGSTIGLLGIGQLLTVALVTGTCSVFFRTAYHGLIPSIVPDEHLDAANARLVGTESTMQVAGPGLGGVLVAAVGAGGAVLGQAASFIVSAACLVAIGARGRKRAASPSRERGHLVQEVREGLAVTVADPYLRFFAITGSLANFGLVGYQSLLVLFMVRDLDLGATAVGLLMGLGAVGGVVGAVIAPTLSRRLGSARTIVVLLLSAGPAALLIAAAGPGWRAWPVAMGPFLVGVGVVGANAVRTAWRQRYTPPELLGRTIGATSALNYGLMPLGGLLAGWLGTIVGVRGAIALMATVLLVGNLLHVVSPLWGQRDLPRQMRPPLNPEEPDDLSQVREPSRLVDPQRNESGFGSYPHSDRGDAIYEQDGPLTGHADRA